MVFSLFKRRQNVTDNRARSRGSKTTLSGNSAASSEASEATSLSEASSLVKAIPLARPRRRILIGSVIVLSITLYFSGKTYNEVAETQGYSPLLQRLNEIAEALPERQLSVLARNAIRGASELPEIETTVMDNEILFRRMQVSLKQVLTSELPERGRANLAALACDANALDCRGGWWAINFQDTGGNGLRSDFEKIHSEALKKHVLEADGTNVCASVDVFSVQLGSPQTDHGGSGLSNWIDAAEACRALLEPELKFATTALLEVTDKINDYRGDIVRIRSQQDALDASVNLLSTAAQLNPTIERYGELAVRHDTLCYASKLLGGTYLFRSADRSIVRNQNEAAAIISAALGLASCNYAAAENDFSYFWPLNLLEVENGQPSPSEIATAAKVFEERGWKPLKAICDQRRSSSCTQGPPEATCRGMQMVFDPGDPQTGSPSRLLFAKVTSTPQVIARAAQGDVSFVNENGAPLDVQDVAYMLCSDETHFNKKGLLSVGLQMRSNQSLPVYIRQQESNRARWDASNQITPLD